ncbi:hypothetical protein [Aeromonas veronii]|uniref:hypothetical protein n=1 Tax=Aeromonas veronii TaxID=654 RepID=UPI003D1D5332
MAWGEIAGLAVGFGLVVIGLNEVSNRLKTIIKLLDQQVAMLNQIKGDVACLEINVESFVSESKGLVRGRNHPIVEGIEDIKKEISALSFDLNNVKR